MSCKIVVSTTKKIYPNSVRFCDPACAYLLLTIIFSTLPRILTPSMNCNMKASHSLLDCCTTSGEVLFSQKVTLHFPRNMNSAWCAGYTSLSSNYVTAITIRLFDACAFECWWGAYLSHRECDSRRNRTVVDCQCWVANDEWRQFIILQTVL